MSGTATRLTPESHAWPVAFTEQGGLHRGVREVWELGEGRLTTPAVAIVGSRHPTAAGLSIAHDFARQLGSLGIQVVSGMALGIDAAAHEGALAGGGSTVAVLGCGTDVCYPARHARLRARILADGLLLSELPPGTEPARWHFPARNRLIAALCCATVVVEAAERSGALSTAAHARELGREVLAVPGSIRSATSAGTNQLIRDGATPLLEIEDLLASVPELRHLAPGAPSTGHRRPRIEPELATVLDRLTAAPTHPDELQAILGLPADDLARRLLRLELDGHIRSLPGGLVERTFRSGP